MILVDSSVWIDYFRGIPTPQADRLDRLLGREPLLVGDLILTEILQGIAADREFDRVRHMLLTMDVIVIGGTEVAIDAARHFRHLRTLGVTVRKTIDTLIATRCLHNDHALLYSDRDFDPFVKHLGLHSAMD